MLLLYRKITSCDLLHLFTFVKSLKMFWFASQQNIDLEKKFEIHRTLILGMFENKISTRSVISKLKKTWFPILAATISALFS
jgi:hypothetical protein